MSSTTDMYGDAGVPLKLALTTSKTATWNMAQQNACLHNTDHKKLFGKKSSRPEVTLLKGQ